jgi:ATP-dependent DNA helicase RecQ
MPVSLPTPKRRISLPRPEPDILRPVASALTEYDPGLAENLREWRRNMAREQKIPAYIVLHDSTLEELCRRRPTTLAGLRQVAGIGERKAEVYGAEILQVLRDFNDGTRAVAPAGKERSPADQTLALLNQGATFEEIARARDRQVSTIVCTVANLIESGRVELSPAWVSPGAQTHIEAACGKVGIEKLADIKAIVPPFVSYDDVRLVVAYVRAQRRSAEKSA